MAPPLDLSVKPPATEMGPTANAFVSQYETGLDPELVSTTVPALLADCAKDIPPPPSVTVNTLAVIGAVDVCETVVEAPVLVKVTFPLPALTPLLSSIAAALSMLTTPPLVVTPEMLPTVLTSMLEALLKVNPPEPVTFAATVFTEFD